MQGFQGDRALRAGRGSRSLESYGKRPCARLNGVRGPRCSLSIRKCNYGSDAADSTPQCFRLSGFGHRPSAAHASRIALTRSTYQEVVPVVTGGSDGGGNGGPPLSKTVGEDGDASVPAGQTANIDAILAKVSIHTYLMC